ncbi:MAG: tRNA preQ1(34) S-adenosylmethionine ribosyltransferase-isomerase QueA [Gemmatimonadaceae bacterium]|nr:tRNA preQ1(34) S-adenosylmethionine ribosyltransferase-isomerase QueA [Gemmatimonadaceae bacterium]
MTSRKFIAEVPDLLPAAGVEIPRDTDGYAPDSPWQRPKSLGPHYQEPGTPRWIAWREPRGTPDGTRVSDYDFHLPEALIAQAPVERRDGSRLLVIHRDTGLIEHRRFRDIVDYIPAGDALVVNTTKVIRARLLGTRPSGAPAEVLLLKALGDDVWEAMVQPGAKLQAGKMVTIADDFRVEMLEATDRGTKHVRLHASMPLAEAIERYGHIPLPPYMTRADTTADAERYQTVYAAQAGSVAAPTAGLHFTDEILAALARKGVLRADVLLHVGAGTFRPISVDDPREHVMHEEWFQVPESTAHTLTTVKQAGGAVWAVGTTSMRTLESAATPDGGITAQQGETGIFIYPPYQPRIVDHLLTNFHLPKSTLVMLVAALVGYELTMRAYREAIAAEYRFYSYGDAMLVV